MATTTPITPTAIRTHAHHGSPPEPLVAGAVWVVWTVSVLLVTVEWVTDVVAGWVVVVTVLAGAVRVWVSVVVAVVVVVEEDWVSVVLVPVPGSGLADDACPLTWAAAPEIALVACAAALEIDALVADPHPQSTAMATPSVSAASRLIACPRDVTRRLRLCLTSSYMADESPSRLG
jgi:hypothetical protein